eukprot:TRINITY_DN67685_c0_g1_i2.p1 TRINITY_DN67685_c0_g1~~TRINITY_DN67685_c0_g1_i2.p1  ORF type:complete len:828 (-),score=363.34 TRINITY_DN67685_c0_g1_i2:58-2307(-)
MNGKTSLQRMLKASKYKKRFDMLFDELEHLESTISLVLQVKLASQIEAMRRRRRELEVLDDIEVKARLEEEQGDSGEHDERDGEGVEIRPDVEQRVREYDRDEEKKEDGISGEELSRLEIAPQRLQIDFNDTIGEGAFGSVVGGVKDGVTRVAVKLMKTVDEQAQRAARKEMLVWSKLQSEHVAQLLGVAFVPPNLDAAFVMKRYDCHLLKYIEKQTKPMAVEKHVDFALQISAGMAELHAAGVLHRDLKPQNVLVDEKAGKVVLADFGLAQFAEASSRRTGRQSESQSSPGTVGYQPPEVLVEQQPWTEKSDVFSFGVLLCVLISGKPAWPGMTAAQIIAAMIKRNKRASDAVESGHVLRNLAVRCEAWDAADRPTFVDIVRELQALQSRKSGDDWADIDRALKMSFAGNHRDAAQLLRRYGDNAVARGWLAFFYQRGGMGVEKIDVDKAKATLISVVGALQVIASESKAYPEAVASTVQHLLGYCYGSGLGVDKDVGDQVRWYRLAADNGHAGAQCSLGLCYWHGIGVAKSLTDAAMWYRRAADQGNAVAQSNVGACYKLGAGVDQSIAQAVQWYRRAAEQQYAAAQFNLGLCYDRGNGVRLDQAEAVKWFKRGAEQGHVMCQVKLGVSYLNGAGVDDADPEQAVRWFRAAAERGNKDGQSRLAMCYLRGTGVRKNTVEAAKWFELAALQGDAVSQVALGSFYEDGEAVPKDFHQAMKWYGKAAEQGDDTARSQLDRLARHTHTIAV